MIDKVSLSPTALNISSEGKSKVDKKSSFADLLKGYLQNVNQQQQIAENTINKFLVGEADVHQVMISLEKADLSFQLMMQIRNKLIEAYQEIMRMQV